MNNQGTIEEFISRLKTRYSHNNPILDLLYLIEMLRHEPVSPQVEPTTVTSDERRK